MKRLLYIIPLCLLIGLVACRDKNPNEFKLAGSINHLTDTMVSLYGIFSIPDTFISVPVENGKFQCTLELDTITPFYLLISSLNYEYPVFADKKVNVKVSGDASDINAIKITGGKAQEEYNEFMGSIRALNAKNDILEYVDSFITTHPYSIVSVYLIDKHFVQVDTPNEDLIDRMINRLSGSMHDHPYVSRLQENIKSRVGSTRERYLPFVNLPDTTGKVLTVDALKEKCMVVTLWASWHSGSRVMQDSLKRLEKRFAKEPVVFLNVSVDTDKQQWLSAIRNDTLKGTHVCDFKGWNSDFVRSANIPVLPGNLILDTSLRIIGRDMWGKQLQEFLEKQVEDLKKAQERKKEQEKQKKKRLQKR